MEKFEGISSSKWPETLAAFFLLSQNAAIRDKLRLALGMRDAAKFELFLLRFYRASRDELYDKNGTG